MQLGVASPHLSQSRSGVKQCVNVIPSFVLLFILAYIFMVCHVNGTEMDVRRVLRAEVSVSR